ncbi:MAG: hypothetical protein DCC67_20580 [Planctomycetota bacterium]|nr:MAG: hypothetical protein DCC67_20580 [Planctomycetota bacterium]
MNCLQRLSVRVKLLLGFLSVSALCGLVGVISISRIGAINACIFDIYDDEMKGTVAALEAKYALACIARDVRDYTLVDDADSRKALGDRIKAHQEKFVTTFEVADETTGDPEDRVFVDQVNNAYSHYSTGIARAQQVASLGDKEDALRIVQELAASADAVTSGAEELVRRKYVDARESYELSEATYSHTRLLVTAVVIGTTVLGATLGLLLSRWIARAVAEVDEVADVVAAASKQLASVSEHLSSDAQQTAASLEESASSLEELTATVRQNADNAQHANQLVTTSRATAERGGAVVTQAISAMSEIHRSSRRVTDIIGTINEIAFQTNLLALNAAVEAARAGEQGRGFAVVAGEVRNLAQRSAAAAKEIKVLIEDSVQKVEVGSELVNRSGETLDAMVASIGQVTTIVGEIAVASRRQTAGLEQLGKAVVQMDQATQSNASQTEEMSGTAVALSRQAEHLQQVVAQFNLKKDPPGKKPLDEPNAAQAPLGPDRATAKRKSPGNTTRRAALPPELMTVGAADHGAFEVF